jgi:maltose O-acetyltransferase
MHNLQDEKKLFYERIRCKSLCHKYNSVSPEMLGIRQDLIKNILGRTKALFLIEQPFMCDYGYNIQIGENFYSNHNLLILDEAPVIFGNDVLVGPNCSFFTSVHPLNSELRRKGIKRAKAVNIGNNVWICGNVTVLPGVTIGDNSVIGAGSVVAKDVPPNSLAVGIPSKVIKTL